VDIVQKVTAAPRRRVAEVRIVFFASLLDEVVVERKKKEEFNLCGRGFLK